MCTSHFIGIHGAPRSGTSWLGQLLNSHPAVKYCYQPFFSYAFRGRADLSTNANELRTLFVEMRDSNDDFVNQSGSARIARSAPSFDKCTPTHLIYKEVRFHHLLPHFMRVLPDFRAIGIVRDPRFMLASWFNAPREFDPTWTLEREWRNASLKNRGLEENWYGFTRWVELTRLFLHLEQTYSDRFTLIRYEDLVKDTLDSVKRLMDFCGLAMTKQTRKFITASTSVNDGDPYGVFRSGRSETVTPPKCRLHPEIVSAIQHELAGTP
ncbi:MAG: sulfotransferase [Xanthomonadales bacterium]|nr:sulfotransferase [Xanthomonadales bacterium]